MSVLASKELWESKGPVAENIQQKKIWGPGNATVKPSAVVEKVENVKQSLRRYPASQTQWDAALAEAIKKSTQKIQRPVAMDVDWKAALAATIPTSPVRGHRAQRSKAVNALDALLDTEPMISMPAFDPAVRHPVFFGSLMESSADFVHPAAEGYVKPRQQNTIQLWSAANASSTQTETRAPLWNGKNKNKNDAYTTLFSNNSSPVFIARPKPVTRSVGLPIISSSTTWKPTTATISAGKHWLHATSKVMKPTPLPELLTSAVWIQPPRHTLFAKTMTSQRQTQSFAPQEAAPLKAPTPAIANEEVQPSKSVNRSLEIVLSLFFIRTGFKMFARVFNTS